MIENDTAIFDEIKKEFLRQEEGIELIASENYASGAVMEAQGSILTNKYAEGYPGKRYYGGCENVDKIEEIAIERAKLLYKVKYANVQPHSGSQANMAVYMAMLQPGDTILGMGLSAGGHLTHGGPANFSGKIYKAVSYDIDENGLLDFNLIEDMVKEHRPKMIVAGASAYPRKIDFQKFGEIAKRSGALLLSDISHISGLVIADLHDSPVDCSDFVTTTTHKTLRGPRGGLILSNSDDFKKINSSIFPGIQGGPLMHVIAAKAVAFGEAMTSDFVDYQKQVIANAKYLAKHLMVRGFKLVTNGTDNHLMLLDLSSYADGAVTGKDAERWLDQAGITVNKNSVPNEKRSPFITSGIRIGTPAVTTRGFKQPEMEIIAKWIDRVLSSKGNEQTIQDVKSEVKTLCKQFPLYIKYE